MNSHVISDPLNIKKGNFYSDNEWGIPVIAKQEIEVSSLVPFGGVRKDGTCHFYLDDYRFERVWNNPQKYLGVLSEYQSLLSPDFSPYADYPMTMQLWNTYRNRWLGRYWQENGLLVIPDVCWSTEDTFEFAFCGVEKGSTIAVSTVGIMNSKEFKAIFRRAIDIIMRDIAPKQIIAYGRRLKDMPDNVVWFEPFYAKYRRDNIG